MAANKISFFLTKIPFFRNIRQYSSEKGKSKASIWGLFKKDTQNSKKPPKECCRKKKGKKIA